MSAGEIASARVGTPPAAAELIDRIGWLIRLRWLAVVGVAAFLEVARRVFPVELELGRLYAVLGALALYNAAISLIHRRRHAAAPAPGAAGIGWLARFLTPRTLLGLATAVKRASRGARCAMPSWACPWPISTLPRHCIPKR